MVGDSSNIGIDLCVFSRYSIILDGSSHLHQSLIKEVCAASLLEVEES